MGRSGKERGRKTLSSRLIDQHTFPWLGLACLLGFGGVGWTAYLLRDYIPKRKRKEIPTPTPRQQAEKELQELQKQTLVTKGRLKQQAAALSSILLGALENQSGKKLKELTTEELAQALPESLVKRDFSFLTFLSKMDRIKFAGESPSAEEAGHCR